MKLSALTISSTASFIAEIASTASNGAAVVRGVREEI
jgi:hypothetical protein